MDKISITLGGLTHLHAAALLDLYGRLQADEDIPTPTPAPLASTPQFQAPPSEAPQRDIQASTPEPANSAAELDSQGVPFNPDVHSETFNQDGTWRRKRFVSKEAYDNWADKNKRTNPAQAQVTAATTPSSPATRNPFPIPPQQQPQPEEDYQNIPPEVFSNLVEQLVKSGKLEWQRAEEIRANCQIAKYDDFYLEDEFHLRARWQAYVQLTQIRDA